MSNPAPFADPHPTRSAAPAPAQALPLQPLDYTSLRAVLSELDPVIVPSRFEKAQQSEAHTLQLGLRTLSGSQWLELSWLAEAPRLLAIPPPPRLGDGSTLAQQLQHGLRGLALVELHQPAWERVVELRFAPRPGEPVERTLVLELMGRHSNLFLLDAERRVIALARQVRDSQSRLRPIGTGDPYQSPPSQAGEPPRPQESFASWRQRLSLLPLPLGKALLAALARLAVDRGCGRLEWSVLDWNEPSIKFYRSLGAVPMDEWTVYRVTGDALAALAQVMDRYPRHYELRDTAGVHQIYYRGGQFNSPLEALRRHYGEAIA